MKKVLLLLLILFGVYYYRDQIKLFDSTVQHSFSSFFSQYTPRDSKVFPQKQIVRVVSEESAKIDAIKEALPSVVTIGISKKTVGQGSIRINPFDLQNPFEQIPGEEKTVEGDIGSGFIISTNGLIVTNKHVVSDTEATYTVITDNQKTYKVVSISRDPLNDLAILKINATNLTAIPMGDSNKLALGQSVIAIGTPLGEFRNSVTAGIVSGLGRGITAGSPYEGLVERLDNIIQTDAAISPGNSGGPLINLSGEVVGINTAVSSQGQNIGFAIPISVVKNLLENYDARNGTITRPFLGIRYQMIDKDTAIRNEVTEGAYVLEVVEKSGAEKAGIQPKDIITYFGGKRIQGDDTQILQKLIASKKYGDKVPVTLWRDGKELKKTITLGISE